MSHTDMNPFFVPVQQFNEVDEHSHHRSQINKQAIDEQNLVDLDSQIENDVEYTDEYHVVEDE